MREAASDSRDFGEALALLRQGRAVCRRRWRGLPQLPRYLMLSKDRARILAVWNGPPARAQQWQSWGDDLLATDWRPVPTSEML